ncbi:YidC/Oxa1 family membrane protein insertase [Peptoniphilus gorbachii]|uniref:YidC/Oxa1 family membrane protein insertase n=1 Tax=Peptoniphilus gorbachii TaxID=411567 RepID=A0ABS2MLC2_9FIRM|nr:YidC/Oxa1 family membrane protein insertase [Peptoniphilus gorbachii]MBS5945462.1 membrane protein insertase YidC [Peptoniphilus harei]MBM7550816.1 YidC/Oxa1 family membrane protein insertase [Peptoniphilus gorbachii]MDU1582314.1 YidC/Oxa1 family membrane protein insertase [Peptoniphilus harei]MDU1663994.1 YidC/Oxa1 family membrane protein insertase [Peptoniphilus harei]MDU5570035.1 YidC/Oxa1 family membrane protein insertase [Peptoniphilus harei]
MHLISSILGIFVKFIYDGLATILPHEPAQVSYFALSIIVATIIIKLLILPLNISQMKNQKKMAKLQPELKKIQKKYKNDPQTLAAKQQKLYKDANTNIAAGCLPMIITMVVLIAFYRVFWNPQTYAFTDPGFYEAMNKNFFYIKNIDHVDPTFIMPVIAAVSTFLVSFITTKNPATQGAGADQAKSMMTTMMVVMPILIFSMARKYAAGLVIYWTVSNIFSIVQQLITNRIVEEEIEEVEVKDK